MSAQNLAVRLAAEPLRSLAFGSISGTYAGLGTAFANPVRLMLIVNDTDVLLTFSLDGVHDHFVLPAGSQLIMDVTTNKSDSGGAFNIAQGTRIYVKGAPTLNSVYLSVFYGSGVL